MEYTPPWMGLKIESKSFHDMPDWLVLLLPSVCSSLAEDSAQKPILSPDTPTRQLDFSGPLILNLLVSRPWGK